jgi:hypothetical protein
MRLASSSPLGVVLALAATLALTAALGCGGKTTSQSGDGTSPPARDRQPGDNAPADGAVTKVRDAATRTRITNNLKMIAIAAHAYHDAYNTMPPAAFGPAGKLSWRVALLPYLEEGELYKQFKLDEPWDSEHNKKLLTKIPKVYAPLVGEAPPGHTFVRAFSGPGAVFPAPPGRVTLAAITTMNGTSNTIMVVDTGEPVPWTAPDELVYDPKAPPRLGAQTPGGFLAAMCDGQVRFFRYNFPPETIARAANYRNTVPFSLDP